MKRIYKFGISMLFAVSVLICSLGITSTAFAADASTTTTYTNLTAAQLVSKMGAGWNLGNTLDCSGDWISGNSTAAYETAWGNPVTTQAMIDVVKSGGFDTIRIPVTWYQHLSTDGKYTIDSAWMARVKTVVDYAIKNNMFVILNIHHENWHNPVYSNLTSAKNILSKVWKQIATEFKNYDQHLIFEGMNEPRESGSAAEWSGGTAENRDCINQLNTTFISAVRAVGGGNTNRCLMIAGNAASSDQTAISAIKVPANDTHIIVSIHAYTPYSFALQNNGTSTFTNAGKSEIDSLFNRINNTFIKKGIPVIIGEYSASNRNNSAQRIAWAKYYMQKAKTLGVPCVLWDNNVYTNNSGSGEAHGHLNRAGLCWYDSNFIKALISAWGGTYTEPPKIEVDFSSLVGTELFSGEATSNSWGQAVSLDIGANKAIELSQLKSGVEIGVGYISNTAPELIFQDSAYKLWVKVAPSRTQDNIVYFTYADMVSAYATAYKAYFGKAPATSLQNAVKIMIGDTGNDLTVYKVVLMSDSDKGKTQIGNCTISGISNKTYTGKSITQAPTITNNGKKLVKDTDYTLTYTSNLNAGTASIKISGKGNYTGAVLKTFTINKKSVTLTWSSTSLTYNGKTQKPVAKYTNVSGKTIAVTVSGAKTNAGTYTATASNIVNYKFTNPKKAFTIAKKSATLTWSATSLTYNGKSQKPVAKYKDISGKTVSATVSGAKTNVGTYTAKASATNYKFTNSTKSFKIGKKSISNLTYSTISNKTYTGNKISPAFTVKFGKTTLVKNISYTVAYSNNIKTGRATITITGKGNYSGTKKLYFNIVPKAPTISSATSKTTKTAKISIKKNSTATGYQFVMAKSKTGTYSSIKTTANNKTLSFTKTGLTKGKTYYFKVRCYKTINGVKVYGSYSAIKSVKIK